MTPLRRLSTAGTAAMLKMLEAAADDNKTALEVLMVYIRTGEIISVLGEASAVLRDILIIKTAQDTDVPRICGIRN